MSKVAHSRIIENLIYLSNVPEEIEIYTGIKNFLIFESRDKSF